MSSTRTLTDTTQSVLDQAEPGLLASALQQVKLGTVLTPMKQTFASLTSAAAQQITTAAAAAAATPGVNTNQEPAATTLPPILAVTAGRITAGTAHQNPFIVTDSGGTPTDPSSGISVATLSDDGTTLTFGAAVTGFVLEYIPRAAAGGTVGGDMQAPFDRS